MEPSKTATAVRYRCNGIPDDYLEFPLEFEESDAYVVLLKSRGQRESIILEPYQVRHLYDLLAKVLGQEPSDPGDMIETVYE